MRQQGMVIADDGHMTDFERFGRITASVVPGILRSNPQMSRKKAWRIVTGREPVHDAGWDAKRGLEHEEDAVTALEVELCALALPGRFVAHPVIGWLGASPDGFIADGELLIPIEAKCPRQLHASVPEMYIDQMQTQLECCDAPYGWFVSWVNDGQWMQKVKRDPEWWAKNYQVLKEFYEEYVVKDIEPPRSSRRTKEKADVQD